MSHLRKEMNWMEAFTSRRHLAGCLRCRMQEGRLEERAEQILALFQLDEARMHHPVLGREKFLERFDEYAASRGTEPRWPFHLPKIILPKSPAMNPTLATCMVMSLAAIVTFVLWFNQRTPNISSNRLLVRAERWDDASLATAGNVIYRSVKISTPEQTIHRTIYRDPQGKRRQKQIRLDLNEEQLKNKMAVAGVDWDEPLSASDYQQWHDRQHERDDSISRQGSHLLMLTTTSAEGPVVAQSLTVRESDFHPVFRRIEFRDNATVEIAEVEYKILPWSVVDEAVFEPLPIGEAASTVAAARVLPFRLPAIVSDMQLDDAELAVRLVLDRLHADTGEQIQIARGAQGIEVTGVVDSDERKAQLQAQLRTVPYVKASIQSLMDVRTDSQGGGSSTTIATASMAPLPSPLETYLLARGHNLPEANALAQKLSSSAIAMSLESKEISDLQTRFAAAKDRSVVASATATELIYSHRERLQAALRTEQELLITLPGGEGARRIGSESLSLSVATEKNLALCKELTGTNSSHPRDTQEILEELSVVLHALEESAHRMPGAAQEGSTGNKKD